MNEIFDRILPAYRQREVHRTRLSVPPERAWTALTEVMPSDLRLARVLSGVRRLPTRIRDRSRTATTEASGPVLATFRRTPWLTLAEEPGRALVAGRIARFWEPVPEQATGVRDADEFRAFGEAGFAKAVISFEVLPDGTGSQLITEMRVQGTDARARRLFALYWLVIRPGSGLIRRDLLHAAHRRCRNAR